MDFIDEIIGNYVAMVAFTAWVSAQVIKIILEFIFTRKIRLERIIGSGGMPSSHSALATGVALATGRVSGFGSAIFGLSAAFAGIVMYDAMGVRRAAGEQAKVLNRMIFDFSSFWGGSDDKDSKKNDTNDHELFGKKLKEYLGHTPFEVLGGLILGIIVAFSIPVR